MAENNVQRNLRKTRVGLVVSDKMDKTIVVAIAEKVRHPLYKKTINRTKKLKAHVNSRNKTFKQRQMLAPCRNYRKG